MRAEQIKIFASKSISIFFVLILFVFITSCEKNLSGFNAIQLLSPPIKYDALVKVGETLNIDKYFPLNTIVSIEIISPGDFGELIYDDSRYIFIAPNHPAVVDISCKIIHETENYSEERLKILIYKQLIFIKADDLIIEPNGTISSRWKKFIKYNIAKQITINAGIVCIYLKRANEEIVRYLQNLFLSGYVEFYNHGYDHVLNATLPNGQIYHEFWNTPLDTQEKHLLMSQLLAKQKLKIILHTFAAPGNIFDRNTIYSMEKVGDIKVWFYGDPNFSGLVLNRTVMLEYPTFHPNIEKFLSQYTENEEYLVLQCHPNAWNDNEFNEYVKIIEFLIAQEVSFLGAYQYYKLRE